MSRKFRGFVAVDVPPSVREFLGGMILELAREFPGYKFVDVKNFHITLEFLGDGVDEDKISLILDCIKRATRELRPFKVELGRAGSIPSRRDPRVLYVGLARGADELSALAGCVREELAKIGFEEDKPFLPHVTIARRKWSGAVPSGLWEETYSRYLSNHRDAESLEFDIGEVFLFESELTKSGPIYTKRGCVALG